MNPLLNEQLGQATHREYEAKYSRQNPSKDADKTQATNLSWQKLAFATGSVTTLIVLASLILTA